MTSLTRFWRAALHALALPDPAFIALFLYAVAVTAVAIGVPDLPRAFAAAYVAPALFYAGHVAWRATASLKPAPARAASIAGQRHDEIHTHL